MRRLVLPLGIGEIPLLIALLRILPLGKQDEALSRNLLIATLAIWISYEFLIVALWSRRLWRGLFYSADLRAAKIIGKELLLSALAKYGATIAVTGYPRKRLHLWPTVGQRIERIQKEMS
jgi:Zn-dependent protease with chaperone function